MILDSLKNKAQYAALHPRFQTVFDFIDNNDVASMPCGRHDIDGDNIFVMVQEMDLREITPFVRFMSNKRGALHLRRLFLKFKIRMISCLPIIFKLFEEVLLLPV